MSIDAGEIVHVSLVWDTAMTHENFVVNDRSQRQPAEYVPI